MKRNIFVIGCVLLSGCVSTTQVPQGESTVTVMASVRTMPKKKVNVLTPKRVEGALTNINYVYEGMTLKQVEEIMGKQLYVGYQKKGINTEEYEPIILKQPYRREVFNKGKKSYEVLYYLTHIENSDDVIADDELTPLIFEKGILVAKGHDALIRMK